MKFSSSTNMREMILGSLFLSIFALFPISMALFFGETLSLGLWFGGAWGLVAGILIGRLILRNPNINPTLSEIDHGPGAAQVQNSILIGMIIGGSGLAHAVLFWLLGENFFGFLIYGGMVALTMTGWSIVIALWRDRKK